MSSNFLASIRASDPARALDRRFAERKLCRVSGLLFVPGHTPMRIKVLDISTKGIALLLPQALPNRTVCEVGFHLHLDGLLRQFSAKIEISNTVFLRRDVRAGCRFVTLGDDSRKVLTAFMR